MCGVGDGHLKKGLEDWIGYEEPRSSTVNNSVLLHWWRGGETERCWYLIAMKGRDDPHCSDRTGRGGALEGLRYTMRRRVMITAVHLGCKSVTIPMDPKRSKGNLPQQNKSLDGYECSTVHITEQEGGGRRKGDKCQHSTGFGILDLAVAGGKVWGKGGGQGDVFVMQGAWKTKRSWQEEVFVLTAVMHGVAGDNHRWGHGNGGAAHAELIGDGIICTAAARLASSGSWKEENKCWKTRSKYKRCIRGIPEINH